MSLLNYKLRGMFMNLNILQRCILKCFCQSRKYLNNIPVKNWKTGDKSVLVNTELLCHPRKAVNRLKKKP